MTTTKKIALLLGMFAGISTVSLAAINPEEMLENGAQSIEVLVSEALENIDETLNLTSQIDQKNHQYKIYNSENKLIYECRDETDAHLKCLLKRSDLLMTTDSSSYYYLAE